MRKIFFLLLSLAAVIFAVAGAGMLSGLPEQAAADRAYYQAFRATAAQVDKHGRLIDNDVYGWRNPDGVGPVIQSSAMVPGDCGPAFDKAPSDRLILSSWRGEWTECYAYPSGRTTLPMRVSAYLLSGMGVSIAICWLLAAAAAWGAFRLRPRKGAVVLAVSR